MTTPTIDNPEFTLEKDGTIAMVVDESGAVAAREYYTDHETADGTKQRAFVSTVVEEDYRGRGLGGKIVKYALDQAIEEGRRIVAVCSYVKNWLEKQDDPKYEQARDTAQPEHLQ